MKVINILLTISIIFLSGCSSAFVAFRNTSDSLKEDNTYSMQEMLIPEDTSSIYGRLYTPVKQKK